MMAQTADEPSYRPIAVIGMHGRFPEGADLSRFFENQLEGRDAIRSIPADRWDWRKVAGEPTDTEDRSYSNRGGFIAHADCFDAGFFGILPREAEGMDPQQRLFLQTAWSALEDAGRPPSTLAGRQIGVFVGVGNADYPVLMRRDSVPIDAHRATGMALTSIANRVSFLLDLHGPSEIIDTACSSSLVAVHRAVGALHNGECEMAIVGGVNLLLGPELFIAFSKAGMLSRKGRCRPFDADCDGYVRSEGVGALLLCPLEVAEQHRDHIYGVLRGSAENHGGRAHSFVAPNAPAQADVIRAAWRRAGLPVTSASFIETHGTGTPLGDPIEINGLKSAIAGQPSVMDHKPVYLRALKSHIGHLEAAAGIAAIISALMALDRGIIPANINHASINPHIDLAGTPFQLALAPIALEASQDGAPPLAGVSSFGFGGVNAHVVLQAHRPLPEKPSAAGRPRLIVLSAKTAAGLRARAGQLLIALSEPVLSTDRQTAMQALRTALGPSAEAASDCTRLVSLHLRPHTLDKALACVGVALGVSTRLRDVRDCVTLGEVADRISTCRTGAPAVVAEEPARLACGVAASLQRMAAASLDEIASTLLGGRDHMRERLAFVAESKDEVCKQLSAFLEPTHPPTVRWHAGAPRSNAIPRPEDESGSDGLAAWARWFVGARDARPRWQDIYDEPDPGHVPLPAYPFEATRFWYRTPVHTSPQHHKTSDARVLGQQPTDPLLALWHAAWNLSPERPSDALVGLAGIAEHAARIRGGTAALNDIRFAPPSALSAAALLGVRRKGATLQCIQDGSATHVLAEARLIGMVRDAPCPPAPPSQQTIDAAELRRSLSRRGLVLSVAIPNRIETSSGALVLPLEATASDSQASFWISALALAIAGWQHLAGDASDAILHPYRIGSLCFGSNHVRRATRLLVAWNGVGSARAVCHDDHGAVAFTIDGVQLRAAPSVRRKVAS